MSMIKILLFIGLAGFAGTLIRYACVKFVDYFFPGFPWGTFVVNVTGAFLAGFCFVLCRCKFQQYEAYFPVLFLGFFGAFTTFSTFALESSRFFLNAQYGKFFLNVFLQNITGIGAAIAGLILAKMLFK